MLHPRGKHSTPISTRSLRSRPKARSTKISPSTSPADEVLDPHHLHEYFGRDRSTQPGKRTDLNLSPAGERLSGEPDGTFAVSSADEMAGLINLVVVQKIGRDRCFPLPGPLPGGGLDGKTYPAQNFHQERRWGVVAGRTSWRSSWLSGRGVGRSTGAGSASC